MNDKIKVLIADDAAFMRKTIRKILESEKRFAIVGTAKNGQEAIKMNNELLPDVVTLDIDMPVMDGITALKHIMVERPVPVVVVSSLSYETNVTFEAFRLGVVDFIPKPTGAISKELEKQKTYLCDVVGSAATVSAARLRRVAVQNRDRKPTLKAMAATKLVIIGSSLGGPAAIIRIVCGLPAHIDFAVLAMTQMSSKVLDSFIHKLDRLAQVKVTKWRGEKAISRGEIYLYSLDQPPLTIKQEGSTYLLENSPDGGQFPIDHTMAAAAQFKQLETGAVLLSGLGSDGVKGLDKIHKKHGKTIVQKVTGAMFMDKPRLAVQQGAYGQVLGDDEIAVQMVKMMS